MNARPLTTPTGSLYSPQVVFPHEGRIRMILDGPDKGDWIGYCAGCDWQIGPRPVDPSLGEAVRDHEREGNRG